MAFPFASQLPLGSKRFGKLWSAARDRLEAPPVDLRYLAQPKGRVGATAAAQVRSDICSFLELIYESVAETLPDFRDEMGGGTTICANLNDPYSVELQKQSKKQVLDQQLEDVPKAKPRKRKHQVEINMDRTAATHEERWLPPGSMQEYYQNILLAE